MSDPLSSLASVLTIAGSAVEIIKGLLTFFRRLFGAPKEIHQWLRMLESLHFALTCLQECGASLDPRYQFSPHFARRLNLCVHQLKAAADEVNKIDAKLAKRGISSKPSWDGRARRSWHKIKWMAIGNIEKKKLAEVVKLYHFEF